MKETDSTGFRPLPFIAVMVMAILSVVMNMAVCLRMGRMNIRKAKHPGDQQQQRHQGNEARITQMQVDTAQTHLFAIRLQLKLKTSDTQANCV